MKIRFILSSIIMFGNSLNAAEKLQTRWLPFLLGWRASSIKIVEIKNSASHDRLLYGINERNQKTLLNYIHAKQTIVTNLELSAVSREQVAQYEFAVSVRPDQRNWYIKFVDEKDSKGRVPSAFLCPSGEDLKFVTMQVWNEPDPLRNRAACTQQNCGEGWQVHTMMVQFCGNRSYFYFQRRTYNLGVEITDAGLRFYSKGGILAEGAHNIAVSGAPSNVAQQPPQEETVEDEEQLDLSSTPEPVYVAPMVTPPPPAPIRQPVPQAVQPPQLPAQPAQRQRQVDRASQRPPRDQSPERPGEIRTP